MTSFLSPFLHVGAALALALGAQVAQAVVFHLDGTYEVAFLGEKAGLAGLVDVGDPVFVQAFYDTDLAVLRSRSDLGAFYDLTAAGVGVSVTVNDLTWRTTGPMTVGVVPVSSLQTHPDGTIAATYGGPQWLGYGFPRTDALTTTIESPFDASGGQATALFYVPTFVTALVPADLSLPTNLTTAQLAGPDFVHGAVAGVGPQGEYFFNFSSPVPEPSTYALMLAGLGLLAVSARKRRRLL